MLTDHLVFSPKFRHGVLTGEVAEDLKGILLQVAGEMGVEVHDVAVNEDHVHLFIQYPPKLSVSEIANRLKGASSRILREMHPKLREWRGGGLWAPSCFHGSVGHGVDVVSAYIRAQDVVYDDI